MTIKLENVMDEGFKINTLDISHELGIKHSQVTRRLKGLQVSLGEVKEGLRAFKAVEVLKEYRGKKFTSYDLDSYSFLLFMSRMKSPIALELVRQVIISNEFNEGLLKTVMSECSELEKEIVELRIFRDVYEAQLKIGGIKKDQLEYEYHQYVVLNFNKIFPEYIYVESEHVLPDNDQVDIIAKDRQTLQPVLIELKIDNDSAHKQLRSYAVYFDYPILVRLSPDEFPEHRKVEGIIYKSYKFERSSAA